MVTICLADLKNLLEHLNSMVEKCYVEETTKMIQAFLENV